MLRQIISRSLLSVSLILTSLMLAAPARAGWRSLTGLLPAHTIISQYEISPGSDRVVFLANIDVAGRTELYSVPITGSVPLKLNPALVNGGNVSRFGITPDGLHVIYTADQAVDNRSELYSVPIGGGAAVKLNGPLVSGGNVGTFKIDPDNVRVVYAADQQTNDLFELFSVPIGGGTAVRLNPTLVSGGDVHDSYFAIDPVGNQVVYAADQETDGKLELYGVPIGGGTAVKLNPPVSSSVFLFEFDPVLPVVVFEAQQTGSSSVEVFSNATSGGLLNKLNFTLAANQDVFGSQISPDGAHVVYNVVTQAAMTSTIPTQGNLYSVLIGGGASTLLTEAADPNFGVYGALFRFTPNSQRIVYRYQKNAASVTKLQSVTLAGTNRIDLHVPSTGQQVYLSDVSADSQWVVYRTTDFPNGYYSIPPTGGSGTFLYGDVSAPQLTPDSSRVLHMESMNGLEYDLWSTQIFGGGQLNLSHLSSAAGVSEAQISPNGQWIVFEVGYASGQKELRGSDGGEGQFYTYLPLVLK